MLLERHVIEVESETPRRHHPEPTLTSVMKRAADTDIGNPLAVTASLGTDTAIAGNSDAAMGTGILQGDDAQSYRLRPDTTTGRSRARVDDAHAGSERQER
ncbi:MAG: hypothetical protein EA417_21675 [Gammaproteobacteria bacterium]|nr:MAG: hypothetical protein EA417_21675 [Gammaproteobacteria bacterium]